MSECVIVSVCVCVSGCVYVCACVCVYVLVWVLWVCLGLCRGICVSVYLLLLSWEYCTCWAAPSSSGDADNQSFSIVLLRCRCIVCWAQYAHVDDIVYRNICWCVLLCPHPHHSTWTCLEWTPFPTEWLIWPYTVFFIRITYLKLQTYDSLWLS